MPKTDYIELPTGETIPILYEDRSVLAIDKPRGWMLVPASWQKTSRNLQMALTSSIANRDFWARSRNLKFLRFVHRLDADTTGILLFAKSLGAVNTFGDLFESRKMEKTYLAVVHGAPKEKEWTCRLNIGPDPEQRGKMKVDARAGKAAETTFRVLQTVGNTTLIEARPYTGRTHQIRVHLAAGGHVIVGDEMYGSPARKELGLRAIGLEYKDPFTRRRVQIRARAEEFCQKYGFKIPAAEKSQQPRSAAVPAASSGGVSPPGKTRGEDAP
ncbi:MAG TPA: RNA pseudouridine synthase [Candidatus Angelobacter sp.]|nr:RNA pseudouridine synthase [Candidatus Angelobacter sp.]